MMDRTVGSLFLLVSLWGGVSSAAGVGSSGGGAAVVCRNSQSGKIERAELLDLYEGRIAKGYAYPTPLSSLEGNYVRAVQNTYRLQSADDVLVGQESRKNLRRFLGDLEFTAPGETLPTLHDLGNTLAAPGDCALEQLAIFNDDKNQIRVNSEIWNALDSLNQAALASHELYYHFERELAESTSEGTRAVVAVIYSSSPLFAVAEGLPQNARSYGTVEWQSENDEGSSSGVPEKTSSFWAYPASSQDGTVLQFSFLMGRPILTRATVLLPGIHWQLQTQLGVDGGNVVCVVKEPGMNIRQIRAKVESAQRSDWEVELNYETGKRVKMGLLQGGVLLEEAFVDSCFK